MERCDTVPAAAGRDERALADACHDQWRRRWRSSTYSYRRKVCANARSRPPGVGPHSGSSAHCGGVFSSGRRPPAAAVLGRAAAAAAEERFEAATVAVTAPAGCDLCTRDVSPSCPPSTGCGAPSELAAAGSDALSSPNLPSLTDASGRETSPFGTSGSNSPGIRVCALSMARRRLFPRTRAESFRMRSNV